METGTNSGVNTKTINIVAYIGIIGWVIALILNSNKPEGDKASFHLRQGLGVALVFFFSWIPVAGWILGVAGLILMIIGIINAANEKEEFLPFVGEYFNEWFAKVA